MRSVTVVRPAGVDQWGDAIDDAPLRWTLEGVVLAPIAEPEQASPGRIAVGDAWTLYVRGRVGLDLSAGDCVEVDGITYAVDGTPQVWDGSPGGTSVVISRVTG